MENQVAAYINKQKSPHKEILKEVRQIFERHFQTAEKK